MIASYRHGPLFSFQHSTTKKQNLGNVDGTWSPCWDNSLPSVYFFFLTGPVIGTTNSPLGLKTSFDQVNYCCLEFIFFVINEETNQPSHLQDSHQKSWQNSHCSLSIKTLKVQMFECLGYLVIYLLGKYIEMKLSEASKNHQ